MMKNLFFAVSVTLLFTLILPYATQRKSRAAEPVCEISRETSDDDQAFTRNGEENLPAISDENIVITKAKSSYLVDYHSGTVLQAVNENKRLPIASMTKLMLLNLCFEKAENGELTFDEKITVSTRASGMGGSQVFLEAGGEYPADDLIKSVIVASANDASVALAERLYGSEESCVAAMNEKCREWALENTSFRNCTGLPASEHFSSAKDVSVILTKLLAHKDYFRYSGIWTDEIRHPKGNVTGLTNTNKLSRFYAGCDGGKTGYTAEAGFCLAATAKRGNMRVVAVVIGEENSKQRFADVSALFDHAFQCYVNRAVVDSSNPLEYTVRVSKGKKNAIGTIAENDFYLFGKKGDRDEIRIDFESSGVTAPVRKGEKVGKLVIYKNHVCAGEVEVLAAEDVKAKVFFDYLKDVASGWRI